MAIRSFGFGTNNFSGAIQDSKIKPSSGMDAYSAFIIWKIKGVSGEIWTPQPHAKLSWSYLAEGNPDALIVGKCSQSHVKEIIQYMQGKKFQQKVKRAYAARNRWEGRPI